MKYYLIWMNSGKVLDICSFDDQETRDNAYYNWVYRDQDKCRSIYDEAQCLNVVI